LAIMCSGVAVPVQSTHPVGKGSSIRPGAATAVAQVAGSTADDYPAAVRNVPADGWRAHAYDGQGDS
jgi:hypothetical protein